MANRNDFRSVTAGLPGLGGFAWTGLSLVVLCVALGTAGLATRVPAVFWLMVACTAANVVWEQVMPDREPGPVDAAAAMTGKAVLALSLALAVALAARGLGPAEYWCGCALALAASLPLAADAASHLAGLARGRRET